MVERETPIEALRERLTELLAEWGADMSAVLTELEQCRGRLRSFEDGAATRDEELEKLGERLRGQDRLIETLRADAASAAELRGDANAKELEIERLKSELDSKQELIRALRRDTENADRLKGDAKRRDRELEELRRDNKRLEAEVHKLEQLVGSLNEAAAAEAAEESAEVEGLRAELEARKSLIKSLRADADRARALEGRLDEKGQVIQQLEATINRHANTIVELKRSAEVWKRKYRELKGADAVATNHELPTLTDTDIAQFDGTEADGKQDRTIAIDMRRSLIEARRAAQTTQK